MHPGGHGFKSRRLHQKGKEDFPRGIFPRDFRDDRFGEIGFHGRKGPGVDASVAGGDEGRGKLR